LTKNILRNRLLRCVVIWEEFGCFKWLLVLL